MTLAALQQAAEARRTAETEYRSAVLTAIETFGAAETARTLGVSRQAVYQLAERAKAEERAMRARLAEIDAKYDTFVDELAARDKPFPAVLANDQRVRNMQAPQRRAKGLGRLPTVLEEVRATAEAKFLRCLYDREGEPFIDAILAELDEAAALRERLDPFGETRMAAHG